MSQKLVLTNTTIQERFGVDGHKAGRTHLRTVWGSCGANEARLGPGGRWRDRNSKVPDQGLFWLAKRLPETKLEMMRNTG